MNAVKPDDINEYIAQFPKETQKVLEQIRAAIKKVIPDAEETISYAMPTFKLNKEYIIYFAGYKKHVSLYPAPRGVEAFKEILAGYKGGKGTVQFPLDKPIPYALITRITKYRLQKVKEKSVKKK